MNFGSAQNRSRSPSLSIPGIGRGLVGRREKVQPMSSVSDYRVLGGGPDEFPRVACAGVAQRGGYVRPGGRSSSSRRAVVLSECLLSDQRKLDRLVCWPARPRPPFLLGAGGFPFYPQPA